MGFLPTVSVVSSTVARCFATEEYSQRLSKAAARSADLDLDALVIGPGPDLRYLTGYNTHVLERLTALVVPADGTCALVIPSLEKGTAIASPIGQLDIELITWDETDDPYALVRDALPSAKRVAVDDRMWAIKALMLRNAMPTADQSTAGPVLSQLRMRKSPAEIAELQRAGRAIDEVHRQVLEFLRVGRTEREVAQDIANAIRREHDTSDFVIVAAGPNSANPHHEPSDRIIEAGDAVVVDLGGTTDAGYCSDSTRVYSMGRPDEYFAECYGNLMAAQQLARDFVRPGVTCSDVDRIARDSLAAVGLGDAFIHRTGHGIGLETHEDPYIVEGNDLPLEPGMAFSIEPGFYLEGRFGARLEDIVVCGEEDAVLCNNRPRELVIID